MISSITLSANSQALVMSLSNGREVSLSADFLRVNARDAVSRREKIDKDCVTVCTGIRIVSIRSVGHTGLNIIFSDGHNRAIYPYPYLQTLAEAIDN